MNGETPQLLDASGRPVTARTQKTSKSACPRCGAPATKRVLSAGFGEPHDICGNCGQDFEERTIW